MPQPSLELTNKIVRAGAGAGKTRGLITEVVRLFDEFKAKENRSPRIVVTTFTRKATQELKERLLVRACENESPELIEYMSDGTKLHISTIHGLLSLFLRQVAHLTGMDPGFQVMDAKASQILHKQVLREVLTTSPQAEAWLEQWSFEEALELCQAWGKSRAASVALQPAALEQLRAAESAHAVFVRRNISQVAAMVLEEMEDPKWKVWAKSLQQLAETWNGDHGALDLPKKPNKLPEFDELNERVVRAIKKIKDVCGEDTWNKDLWPAMLNAWEKFQPLAMAVDEKVRERKTLRGLMDMEDLELRALEVLRDRAFLGETFAANWDVWLIDEFQDTSQIQFEILNQVRGSKPVYYVGDPQQSIYLFRGARPEIFTEQWERMGESEKKQMQENWRSDAPLLNFINDLVGDLGAPFQKMIAKKSTDMGSDTIAATVIRAPSIEAERRQIVDEVLTLVEGGARFEQICILGRKHKHLMDLAALLKARGLPTHVHSPAGFWQRRETLDIYSLWKFLINPHNNENLITLLRTPYFYVPDAELAELMRARPNSLWRKLCSVEKSEKSVQILKQAQSISEEIGIVAALEWALIESGVFDLALQNDPAGRKESNLWKFLVRVKESEREGGAGFLSMEPTVQDEEAATEGDAATSQEPNCINLMTIHGSKGLEFDYVIIPHMGDGARITHTPKFHAENGGFGFKAIEDDEGNGISSPLEKAWVVQQREREKEEARRLLYVAATRARKRLWLTSSEVAENSWASWLSMFAHPAGIVRTAHYTMEIRDATEAPAKVRAVKSQTGEVRKMFMQPSQAPTGRRRSVTEILGQSGESNQAPAKTIFNVAKKKSEGVLVHKILEALRYGHSPADLKNPRISQAVAYVQGLKTPPMQDLLKNSEAEWGFQLQTPSDVVEGQIDLWGKAGGVLWIIDYKSGSEAYKEKAFEQLSLYSWALQQFGHRENIKMAVIYPLSGQIEIRDFSKDLALHWENEFRAP